MTQNDLSILDKQLKGINVRLIWALVVCTAVSVSTVLSVYYGFKKDQELMSLHIKFIESRLDRIESKLK